MSLGERDGGNVVWYLFGEGRVWTANCKMGEIEVVESCSSRWDCTS